MSDYGEYKAHLKGARMIKVGGRAYPAAMPADYRTIYDQYRGAGAGAISIAESIRKQLRAADGGNENTWQEIARAFHGTPSRETMREYLEHEIIVLQWISDARYMESHATDRQALPEVREAAQERRRVLSASSIARKTLIKACQRLGIQRREMPDFQNAKAAWKVAVMRAHPDKGGNEQWFMNVQEAWDRVKREYGWSD